MPRTPAQVLLLGILIGPSALSFAVEPNVPNPAAAQVVNDVIATYGAMTSYRDRGVSISRVANECSTTRREFETTFKRPDKLRFAWTEKSSDRPAKVHSAIWSAGGSAWCSYAHDGNKPELEPDLGVAVAGATAVSAGAAHTISRLLNIETTGFRIDDLEDYSIAAEESIDGVACVKLTAHYRSGPRFTMWVGRDDHLIRKIVDGLFGEEHVETRTGIVVNREIPDSAFHE